MKHSLRQWLAEMLTDSDRHHFSHGSWPPIELRRARAAVGQLQDSPECIGPVADEMLHARQLLHFAEIAAESQYPDETIMYFSYLSEFHAQDAARRILRARRDETCGGYVRLRDTHMRIGA